MAGPITLSHRHCDNQVAKYPHYSDRYVPTCIHDDSQQSFVNCLNVARSLYFVDARAIHLGVLSSQQDMSFVWINSRSWFTNQRG